MNESQRLSLLIGDIYDAALNPARWPAALDAIAQFAGGPEAALISKDATRKHGTIYYDNGGLDPHYIRLYFEKYVKLDPSHTAHFFAEIEQPISTVDFMPLEEFYETRFWKEWAQPQGLIDYISVALDKTATSAALFGMFRHERDGPVDDETRRRVRLLAPHIRRAALIGNVVDLKTAEAETFAAVLDEIKAGMFLLEAEGRIAHANPAGHAMLDAGAALYSRGGGVAARDPSADRLLREALHAAGQGDTAIGCRGVAVPLLAGDGRRYVAHILPLGAGARRRTARAYTAAVALFVHEAALESTSPPEIIAKTFKLTPSELRVLLAVVEIGGVPEVAAALGIAETTVKTHLGHLYEKTGCSRQADLVKLVAGFASPLLG